MMYGRKNVCLDPFYPLAKFEQNRKTFLPRHGTARPGPARPGPAVTLLRRLILGNYAFYQKKLSDKK